MPRYVSLDFRGAGFRGVGEAVFFVAIAFTGFGLVGVISFAFRQFAVRGFVQDAQFVGVTPLFQGDIRAFGRFRGNGGGERRRFRQRGELGGVGFGAVLDLPEPGIALGAGRGLPASSMNKLWRSIAPPPMGVAAPGQGGPYRVLPKESPR
jgi:hypothetical protein